MACCGAAAWPPVVSVGTAPSGLAMASCRYSSRAEFLIRLLAPKPSANSGASSGGVVGGVMAAKGGAGGVLLNSAVCGSLPWANRASRVRVEGSSVSMPVA